MKILLKDNQEVFFYSWKHTLNDEFLRNVNRNRIKIKKVLKLRKKLNIPKKYPFYLNYEVFTQMIHKKYSKFNYLFQIFFQNFHETSAECVKNQLWTKIYEYIQGIQKKICLVLINPIKIHLRTFSIMYVKEHTVLSYIIWMFCSSIRDKPGNLKSGKHTGYWKPNGENVSGCLYYMNGMIPLYSKLANNHSKIKGSVAKFIEKWQ